MEVIPGSTQDTMTEFARRNIEIGSTIISDKMTGFDRSRWQATRTNRRSGGTSARGPITWFRSPIGRWGT